jgi:hypothetical protein
VLFGEHLVARGYCTEEDVLHAVDLQKAGDKRLIGRILLDAGIVTWPQIEEVIDAIALNIEQPRNG